MADLQALRTLDDVREFIREGYRASGDPNSRWNRDRPQLAYGFEWGGLPLSVAKPGLLIEHAVRLAGSDGLTLQQVRAGRLQGQVVLRAPGSLKRTGAPGGETGEES